MALQRFGDAESRRASSPRCGAGPAERHSSGGQPWPPSASPGYSWEPDRARDVLALLEQVTTELPALGDRRSDEFRTLRKTLGYAWSVAVVALPEEGKPLFEPLLDSDDPDVRWITRENLRKKRLERMDREWVAGAIARAQRR